MSSRRPSRQDRFLVVELRDGLVMTMAVQHHVAIERGRLVAGTLLLQELAEQERLLRQPLRVLVAGKQVDELVAKYREAARFEHDDRRARCQVRRGGRA